MFEMERLTQAVSISGVTMSTSKDAVCGSAGIGQTLCEDQAVHPTSAKAGIYDGDDWRRTALHGGCHDRG